MGQIQEGDSVHSKHQTEESLDHGVPDLWVNIEWMIMPLISRKRVCIIYNGKEEYFTFKNQKHCRFIENIIIEGDGFGFLSGL